MLELMHPIQETKQPLGQGQCSAWTNIELNNDVSISTCAPCFKNPNAAHSFSFLQHKQACPGSSASCETYKLQQSLTWFPAGAACGPDGLSSDAADASTEA